jgi:hypothetical protein
MYGFNTTDISDARCMRMSGGSVRKPLTKIKEINCASLPPCTNTLASHIKRANYVARIWKRADLEDPTGEKSPEEYG